MDEVIRLTAKQEAFAQAVVVNGGDKVAAYKAAGYSTRPKPAVIGVKADELYNNGNVSVRIAQLRITANRVVEERFKCTVESLCTELEEVRVAALIDSQLSAANSAIMGKAKLFGLDRPLDRPPEKPEEKITRIKVEVVGGRA